MQSRLVDAGIAVALAALTLVAFGDLFIGDYEFVSFDDYHYVRNNPHVHAGLTIQSVWWSLTNYYALHWHPLTWISLQLDYEIYGLNPRGFHLTNLLFHVANTILVFLVLRRSTGTRWPAAVVAALFAVHPLHVESVAWVTERKDMLSTFFWMLTLLAYFRYAQRPSAGRYLLVLICLTFGLMSKPMVVTLPCVLLLLDYWPLRRWGNAREDPSGGTAVVPTGDAAIGHAADAGPRFAPASFWRLLLEKTPLLLLAAGCMALTVLAHAELIDDSRQKLPFWIRVLNVPISYVAYLRQMFWPSDLAAVYLHPMERLSSTESLVAVLCLAAVTLAALCWRRRRPYFLVGWLWYLGTLVPVIGLIQVGMHARADRFTYIPLIGIFVALVWGVQEWLGRRRIARALAFAATAIILIACTVVTRAQLRHWRNSASLWNRVVQVATDVPHAHMYVAYRHLVEGDIDLAIERANMARELQPENWQIHGFLGMALARKGSLDEAIESMTKALALNPDSADLNSGIGDFLWQQGKIPAANKYYAEAARLEPHSADGQYYQGTAWHREGKLTDAVRSYQEAIRLAPDRFLYYCDLALALEDLGDRTGAVNAYRVALDLDPEWPSEWARQAWLLATHPDPARRDGILATRRARQACSISHFRFPPFLESLAAAHAEAGLFKDAVAAAAEARRMADEQRQAEFVDRLDRALKLYRNGQPFRDASLK